MNSTLRESGNGPDQRIAAKRVILRFTPLTWLLQALGCSHLSKTG
jgi:hypothetical protein